jgi:hypothetical protein
VLWLVGDQHDVLDDQGQAPYDALDQRLSASVNERLGLTQA